jgi:hypothetical protein
MNSIENRLKDMITKPTNTKESAAFYVKYLGMPEHVGNFLGRQTIGFTPPAIEYDVATHHVRHNAIQDTGRLSKSPINLTLRCDDVGYVEAIMLNQILVQTRKTVSSSTGNRGEGFDLRIEYFTETKKLSRYVVYSNCRIQTLTFPPSRLNLDDVPMELEVTAIYDTMSYYSDIGDLLVEV